MVWRGFVGLLFGLLLVCSQLSQGNALTTYSHPKRFMDCIGLPLPNTDLKYLSSPFFPAESTIYRGFSTKPSPVPGKRLHLVPVIICDWEKNSLFIPKCKAECGQCSTAGFALLEMLYVCCISHPPSSSHGFLQQGFVWVNGDDKFLDTEPSSRLAWILSVALSRAFQLWGSNCFLKIVGLHQK